MKEPMSSMDFKSEFENFYKNKFGTAELNPPVFERFPMCVRFNIGDSKIDDEKEYIKQSTLRAQTIFDELFRKDDAIYLIVDSYAKFQDFYDGISYNNIDIIRPFVLKQTNECCYEKLFYKHDDTVEENPYSRYIIETSVNSLNKNELLSQIIKSELGGNYSLSDSLYIINKNTGVLYFLYNDVGLDVVSGDKNLLESVSTKFAKWVSDIKL